MYIIGNNNNNTRFFFHLLERANGMSRAGCVRFSKTPLITSLSLSLSPVSSAFSTPAACFNVLKPQRKCRRCDCPWLLLWLTEKDSDWFVMPKGKVIPTASSHNILSWWVLGSGPERNVMVLITNKCPFYSLSDIALILSNAHALLLLSDGRQKTNKWRSRGQAHIMRVLW